MAQFATVHDGTARPISDYPRFTDSHGVRWAAFRVVAKDLRVGRDSLRRLCAAFNIQSRCYRVLGSGTNRKHRFIDEDTIKKKLGELPDAAELRDARTLPDGAYVSTPEAEQIPGWHDAKLETYSDGRHGRKKKPGAPHAALIAEKQSEVYKRPDPSPDGRIRTSSRWARRTRKNGRPHTFEQVTWCLGDIRAIDLWQRRPQGSVPSAKLRQVTAENDKMTILGARRAKGLVRETRGTGDRGDRQ